jgi:AraC-like DNA-binding protein
MLFERTELVVPESLPVRRSPMFRQREYFAFTRSTAPSLSVQTAALRDARLHRVRSTGHEIRLAESEHISFLLPRRGTIEVATAHDRFVARPGETLLFAPNTRTTTVVPDPAGEFACDCLMVPVRQVAEVAAGPERRLWPHAGEFAFAGNPAVRPDAALYQYLDLLIGEGLRPGSPYATSGVRDAAGVLLHELMAELLERLESPSTNAHPAPRRNLRLVRAAEDLLAARLDQPVKIDEIARALGTSVRRLQYAFRQVRDTTPRRVLSELRLEAARRRLTDPGDEGSVTCVALDCGIAHFGRFAAAYAARYGELPSVTRQHASRR